MRKSFTGSKDAAQFVNDQLQYLREGLPLTMTITLEKSGELSVSTATGTLLVDAEGRKAWPYLEKLQTI